MRDATHPSDATRNEYVDGRCRPLERENIETHLAACTSCRDGVAALRSLRSILAAERERTAAPDLDFEARLRNALDASDASLRPARGSPAAPRPRRLIRMALAVAAAAAIAVFWLTRGIDLPAQDLATAALADADSARAGRHEVGLATADAAALTRFHRENGIAFRSRVLDLAMMGWTLEGGGVDDLAGRPSAFALYRDAAGRWLVCRMFEGEFAALPSPQSRFEAGGFTFHVYRNATTTAVFWREGDVLCVLSSDLPEEQVRALAVAKAMLPG